MIVYFYKLVWCGTGAIRDLVQWSFREGEKVASCHGIEDGTISSITCVNRSVYYVCHRSGWGGGDCVQMRAMQEVHQHS